jgi:hypothetical protein
VDSDAGRLAAAPSVHAQVLDANPRPEGGNWIDPFSATLSDP